MKRKILFLGAALVLATLSVNAQDQSNNPKTKKKTSREIVIQDNNADDKGKTVIIIDDGKITVNGKPVTEWPGGKVTIRSDDDGFFVGKPFPDGDLGALNEKVLAIKAFADQAAFGGVRLGVFTKENVKGAEVNKVIDSSAAFKAGLKTGDIITKVDETPISDPEALARTIRSHHPGDVVTVRYLRGTGEQTTKVTMEKPKEAAFNNMVFGPEQALKFKQFAMLARRPRLGAGIQDTEDTSGVKVTQVEPESPAAKAGLQKDDVITAIDGKKVTNVDDARDIINDNDDKYNYPVTVNRGGRSMTLQVKIPRELRSANL